MKNSLFINSELSENQYNQLLLQADLELAKRGFTGPILYVLIFLSFPFATSIYDQYPDIIIYPGILMFLFSTLRFCLSLYVKKFYPDRMVLWRKFRLEMF